MVEDSAAIRLPATLTIQSTEIPASGHGVWAVQETPQSHIHRAA